MHYASVHAQHEDDTKDIKICDNGARAPYSERHVDTLTLLPLALAVGLLLDVAIAGSVPSSPVGLVDSG